MLQVWDNTTVGSKRYKDKNSLVHAAGLNTALHFRDKKCSTGKEKVSRATLQTVILLLRQSTMEYFTPLCVLWTKKEG